MGGRSAEALARRAAKRGRTIEEQAAADELETSKKAATASKATVTPAPAAPAPAPAPAPAEPSPAATSAGEADAADGDGKRRPKQPLPANHLQGSRRNGAKRKKLKESYEAAKSGAPLPPPRKELPKPKENTSGGGGASSSKAPAPAEGAKRVRASTKEGLVVWLTDGEQPVPMVIRRSEIREPPEPRASPKYLFLETLGEASQQGPGRWVHSAEVLPLDARFKELWRAHHATPKPREALRQAVLQQQRTLAHLSVQELWSQLLGDGGDEPWPAK